MVQWLVVAFRWVRARARVRVRVGARVRIYIYIKKLKSMSTMLSTKR